MTVRIRLTRVGATKQPTYRLVVADARSARDGRAIDTIGHYNPRTDPIELVIDEAKAKDWLSKGAQPSDTVKRLLEAGRRHAEPEVGPTMAAAELVEYVAKSLVDDVDAVHVEVVNAEDGTIIELHVAESDMGKVIGRNGSVAKALRTLLKVTSARTGETVSLEIV